VIAIGLFIIGVVGHTPPYVWGIFALVLFMAYQRSRERTVHLWQLFLFPALMIVTAVSGLIGAGLSTLPAILAGLAIGGVAGWLLERDGATRRLPDGRLWLRGEWWSVAQVILIFGFRYSLAAASAIAPALVADPAVHLTTAFVSSLVPAMILARMLARLRVYITSSRSVA
jgi:hypothetical protein